MHDPFVAKGIPVYLGEYGLLSWPDHFQPDRVESGEGLKYFEHLGYRARVAGVTTALWDPFSLLNRATLQWRDPALFNWIKSSWTTRSGTISFDKVFLPKSSPITAQTLALTAGALTRLAGDRACGVNATLQARFSRELPWNIDVVTTRRSRRTTRTAGSS